MIDWMAPFKVQGMDAWWLPASPTGVTTRCDRCKVTVWPERPRFRIANGLGPERKANHGHRHQYLCIGCAWMQYSTTPPIHEYVEPVPVENFTNETML